MFRNAFKKEAGQGITEVALVGAAFAGIVSGIIQFVSAFFGA
jgi:hypothetical protein